MLTRGEYPHVYTWFGGGLLNLSQLALDRHASSKREKVALIWEGEPTDAGGNPSEVRKLTYGELLRDVNRFAYLLKHRFGLKKGDKIAVYMPLIPEAIVVLLAAARLGATFTVVFSGFSADSLASRMTDLGATLLVTADGFYRRGKAVRLKEIADKALEQSTSVENTIVVRRLGGDCPMKQGRDYFLDDLLLQAPRGRHGRTRSHRERSPALRPLYLRDHGKAQRDHPRHRRLRGTSSRHDEVGVRPPRRATSTGARRTSAGSQATAT